MTEEMGQRWRVRVARLLVALASFFFVAGLYFFFTAVAEHDATGRDIGIQFFITSAIFVVVWTGVFARIRKYERIRWRRMGE